MAKPALAIHDHLAAQEHLFGQADQLPVLKQVVIGAVVGAGAAAVHAVGQAQVGVPHNNVGIRAGQQGAFAGVEAEDAGRVGAGEGNELVGGQAASAHAVRPQHRQAVANAGQAVGNLGEVVSAQLFAGDGDRLAFIDDGLRAVIEEGAVVGANGLDDALSQALPQALVVSNAAHRRGANPLGAIWAAQVVNGEEEIGRAGFAHHRQAALAGVGELVHLAGDVHVDHVERGLCLGGQGNAAQGGFDGAPGGAGEGVPFGGCAAGSQALGDQDVNHVAILGVQQGQ